MSLFVVWIFWVGGADRLLYIDRVKILFSWCVDCRFSLLHCRPRSSHKWHMHCNFRTKWFVYCREIYYFYCQEKKHKRTKWKIISSLKIICCGMIFTPSEVVLIFHANNYLVWVWGAKVQSWLFFFFWVNKVNLNRRVTVEIRAMHNWRLVIGRNCPCKCCVTITVKTR